MSTSSRAWIKPVIAAVAVAVVGIGAYAAVAKREVAPQLTFLSIKGDKITADSLKGKVVMVNFWATSTATNSRPWPLNLL
jgi:hypothetical protein